MDAERKHAHDKMHDSVRKVRRPGETIRLPFLGRRPPAVAPRAAAWGPCGAVAALARPVKQGAEHSLVAAR
eukprot:3565724-Pyramimonas_sp.AAC.1